MEKSTWRETKFDAFSINLDELEGFCSRLREEFDNADDVSVSITFEFPKEELTFSTVEEIRDAELNCKRITDFSIRLSSSGKSYDETKTFRLLKYFFFIEHATIHASSDNEAWCAGINDVALSCLRKYRAWYYWIIRGWVWWPLSVVLYLFILTIPVRLLDSNPWIDFKSGEDLLAAVISTAWVALAGYIILTARKRFLPLGLIRIHDSHATKISIEAIVGILTLIIGIIALIFAFIE